MNTDETRNGTYQTDFTYYQGIVGQTTNVFMNFINIFISFGGNPKNRIPYTLGLCSIVILFQVVLAILNSQTCNYEYSNDAPCHACHMLKPIHY